MGSSFFIMSVGFLTLAIRLRLRVPERISGHPISVKLTIVIAFSCFSVFLRCICLLFNYLVVNTYKKYLAVSPALWFTLAQLLPDTCLFVVVHTLTRIQAKYTPVTAKTWSD